MDSDGETSDTQEKKPVKKFNKFDDDLENENVIIKHKNVPTVIIKAWGNIKEDKYK